MTILTVKIDNKKSEKAVMAILDALDLTYSTARESDLQRPLNKTEHRIYKNLKS